MSTQNLALDFRLATINRCQGAQFFSIPHARVNLIGCKERLKQNNGQVMMSHFAHGRV